MSVSGVGGGSSSAASSPSSSSIGGGSSGSDGGGASSAAESPSRRVGGDPEVGGAPQVGGGSGSRIGGESRSTRDGGDDATERTRLGGSERAEQGSRELSTEENERREREAEQRLAEVRQIVERGGLVYRGTGDLEAVREVQRAMNRAGAQIEVDGYFGPETLRAVRDFQRAVGAKVDGLVGPETLGAMMGYRPGADAFARTAGAVPVAGRLNFGRGIEGLGASRTTPPLPERALGRPQGAPPLPGRAPGRPAVPPPLPDRAPRSTGTVQGTPPLPERGRERAANPNDRTARITSVRNRGARNQMVEGDITINGNTYRFRSGGYGRGSAPTGSYTITPHRWSRPDRAMNVGGVGYSFAMSDKYDPRVNGTRTLLRIHPDGRGPGTMGCIGIVGNGAIQRRFREDMRAELARNGGRFTLQLQ